MLRRLIAIGVIVPLGLGSAILGSQDPLFTALGFAAYVAVGGLVLLRRDGHNTGWLLLLVGVTIAGADAVVGIGYGSSNTLGVWVESWIWSGVFVLFTLLILTFPSGHLPRGGRLARVTRIAVYSLPALLATQALTVEMSGPNSSLLIPNPVGFLPNWLGTVAYLLISVILLLAVASLVVRRRRSTGLERQQFTWVVFASVLLMIAIGVSMAWIFGSIALGHGDPGDTAWIPTFMMMVLFPISFGVAILRYRLFDIDRIVSRTVTYTVVVALLAVVYLAAVTTLTSILPATSQLAVAASTLSVALLFNPLRHRIRDGVDRRFDRRGYDAARLGERFAAQLQLRSDPSGVIEGWITVVDDTMRPGRIGVWLSGTGTGP